MSLITRMRRQTAVYWGPPVDDGNGGFTWPAAVEIACRWEEVKGAVKDPRTHETLSDSTIYVDRAVAINGYLWLGELADAEVDPTVMEEAKKITGYSETPNLRNTEVLRMAKV
jgi:hypothetical protein